MYLIYSGPTSQTGRALGESLGIGCGTAPPKKVENLLVRWGSTETVEKKPQRVLNKRNSILLATDKLKSWSILKASGVPTPEIVVASLAQELKGRIKFPVLGRTRHHTQGQDIVLCMQAMDIKKAIDQGSEYFIEYIQTAREYRVHVFNGQIIRTSQKLWSGEKYTPYIRNVDNGYVFGLVKTPLTHPQEQACIQAVSVLGLDFGAVDIIISDDNRPYILEVNTGPALCPQGLETYMTSFRNFIAGMGM